MKRRNPVARVPLFPQLPPGVVAQFPRTIGPADPRVATRDAIMPLGNVYEGPVQAQAPALPAMPPTGVTEDSEVRSVQIAWPVDAGLIAPSVELPVYTTVRPWRAVDVYLQDLDALTVGMVLAVRVYALSTSGPPTLVASGRAGHLSAAGALRVPLWICAARAQAQRFLVTFSIGLQTGGALPAPAGQFATITIIGSNEANEAPPLLGAVPLGLAGNLGGALLSTNGIDSPELLMVQGILGPAVAAPMYLQVHNVAGALAGLVPQFCFPMGAGVAAAGGGGFGCTHWFPGGYRQPGVNLWQIGISSTSGTFTAAGGSVQGLCR